MNPRVPAHPAIAFAMVGLAGLVAVSVLPTPLLRFAPTPTMAALAAVGCGLCVLSLRADPAWSLSGAISASMFSGNWANLQSPLPVDRLLLLLAVGGVVLRLPITRPMPIRLGTVHIAVLAAAVFATASAVSQGIPLQGHGMFALLDRFGLIPLIAFVMAPLAFDTPRRRAILLGFLLATGGYLGMTALAEGAHLNALVWPGYILDPAVGIHAGRARGPFTSGTAMGAALWPCAVAAVMVVATTKDVWLRRTALLVAALCTLGVFFTLTRTTWLAAAVSALVTLGLTPTLRRYILPAALTGALLVGGAMVAIPGLAAEARQREATQASIWDRKNSNAAALRMLEARPLLGFGWDRFKEASPPYYHQAFAYPLTAVGEVHNVFLSNLAELGLIGTFLWLVALVIAVGVPLVRPPPPALRPWRVGLLAIATMWVVVANFDPLPYVFPNLLLWTWAGILWGPMLGTSTE